VRGAVVVSNFSPSDFKTNEKEKALHETFSKPKNVAFAQTPNRKGNQTCCDEVNPMSAEFIKMQ
jgi:hypothetical protein